MNRPSDGDVELVTREGKKSQKLLLLCYLRYIFIIFRYQ